MSTVLSSSWSRFFTDFEAGAERPERQFVSDRGVWNSSANISLMVSKIDFGANRDGFGGHVGPEFMGRFGPSMATRWYLTSIENDMLFQTFIAPNASCTTLSRLK